MPVEITGLCVRVGKDLEEALFAGIAPGLKPRPPKEEEGRPDPPYANDA